MSDPIKTGERVRALLEDPAVQGALADVRERLHAEWVKAPTTELREEIWQRRRGMELALSELRSIVTTGKLAQSRAEGAAQR